MPERIPPFSGNLNFNAQHAPIGAFCSFTLGHFGTGGGIGVEIGRPASHDIYIGVKDGDRSSKSPLRCLPFYKGATSPYAAGKRSVAADFLVEQAGPAEQTVKPNIAALQQDQI